MAGPEQWRTVGVAVPEEQLLAFQRWIDDFRYNGGDARVTSISSSHTPMLPPEPSTDEGAAKQAYAAYMETLTYKPDMVQVFPTVYAPGFAPVVTGPLITRFGNNHKARPAARQVRFNLIETDDSRTHAAINHYLFYDEEGYARGLKAATLLPLASRILRQEVSLSGVGPACAGLLQAYAITMYKEPAPLTAHLLH